MAPGAKAGTKPRPTLVAALTPAGADADTEAVTAAQRALLEALAGGPVVASELGTPALRRLEKRGLVSDRGAARRPAAAAARRRPGGRQPAAVDG